MSDTPASPLEQLVSEIAAESSASPRAVTFGETTDNIDTRQTSRSAFRVHDFDMPRDKEMAVFTHAKKLGEYIFVVTEKSPKKYRWSIVTRLHNSATEVVECLYRANVERGEDRELWLKRAQVAISLVDFYTETAYRLQALSGKQTGVIARALFELKKLLAGWIKSVRSKSKQ